MAVKVASVEAAAGLLATVRSAFRAETGEDIVVLLGGPRALAAGLRRGGPADLVVTTRAAVGELTREGLLQPASAVDIGQVATCLAVRAGEPRPVISTAMALSSELVAADGIYLPDPEQTAAGQHLARVIRDLGIRHAVQGRLRPYPSGAAALRALGEARHGRLIGCAEATEILAARGVDLVGPLPSRHATRTVYTAAVSTGAEAPHLARRLAAMLAGPDRAEARSAAGFEMADHVV